MKRPCLSKKARQPTNENAFAERIVKDCILNKFAKYTLCKKMRAGKKRMIVFATGPEDDFRIDMLDDRYCFCETESEPGLFLGAPLCNAVELLNESTTRRHMMLQARALMKSVAKKLHVPASPVDMSYVVDAENTMVVSLLW